MPHDSDRVPSLPPGGARLGIVQGEYCDFCGNWVTEGGGTMWRRDTVIRMMALCRWCIAYWLGELTGFKVVEQLGAWEAARKGSLQSPWSKWREIERPVIEPADE